MSDKTIKEILEQQYLSANDLIMVIPTLSYSSALKYIKRIRANMKKENYFIPESKTLIALTWMIKKDLGIK